MTSSPSNSEKPVYARHEKAHANGGIHLKDDPDSTVSVRSVVLNLIKSFGSKLKEGKVFDLLKVSRPAMISYPRTYLECVAHDLVYTNLLDKAATATDPVQRMKYLIGFFVAGLHRNAVEMGNNGPLNPVLGETFIAEKADGTKLYCEQISHHPPVSAYHMIDANGNYKLYGTGEVSAKLSGMNCLEGKRIGHTTIEFKDGGKVIIGNPEMIIEGVMMGDRIINHVKTFTFVDTTNKITAEIKFNYTPAGTVAKITSGFKNLFGRGSKNAEEKILNDTFVLEIFSTENQERKVLASGLGSWLSFVEIDGEALWQVTDAVETKWNEECNGRLDSDSTKRLDSQFIRIKDFKNAQKEKDLLENNQRLDAKIRKTGAKGTVKADA